MKNHKGMTLIEIIISIAIIAIISVAFLAMFSSGFKGVVRAGNLTESGYRAFGQAELTLMQKDNEGSPSGLLLTFTSDGSTVNAAGNVESLSDSDVTVTIFQPKY